MGEGGFSELFGGPGKDVARAKKPVPVQRSGDSGGEEKPLWIKTPLLRQDLKKEFRKGRFTRNIPPEVDIPPEKELELKREASQRQAEKKAAKEN